ncbi:MAG TPA: phage terminase small subunit P27 family [Planctomycetaceae bacterium]|jgi:P27 family predicted phage terminase small subunit|nr:phage terminase small subunit P27 family [Planctomycetaceae bacterium]
MKKSKEQHKREGTFNATRHGKGELPRSVPPMPADMNESAAAFWKPISLMLDTAGLLTEMDGLALRMLCETLVVRREALDSITTLGVLVDGYRGSKVKNPAIAIYHTSTSAAMAICRQLGLTPKAREGMTVMPEPEMDDEMSEILGFDTRQYGGRRA